jgi:hypothetical protein
MQCMPRHPQRYRIRLLAEPVDSLLKRKRIDTFGGHHGNGEVLRPFDLEVGRLRRAVSLTIS